MRELPTQQLGLLQHEEGVVIDCHSSVEIDSLQGVAAIIGHKASEIKVGSAESIKLQLSAPKSTV